MSILSRIRRDVNAAERRAQQTSARDIARKAKQQAQELRRKAGRDVDRASEAVDRAKREAPKRARSDARRAEERARRKKDELKRKAKRDVRAAERRGLTGLAKSAAGAIETEEIDGDAPQERSDGVVRRAGNAAMLRTPVNATLDPGADGPALEMFAMAQPMDPLVGQNAGQEGDTPDDSQALIDDEFIGGGGSMDLAVGISVSGDMGDLESKFFGDNDG